MKGLTALSGLLLLSACVPNNKEDRSQNVLFIMVDDLRPALGTYGYPDVISPNIDQLASEGIQFNRSYCNVPVCGASRASLLVGLRPHWPDRFLNYHTRVEKDCPTTLTLPEHFVNNGYIALSDGKVFHHQYDKQGVWSNPPWRPDITTVIDFSNVNYLDSASIQYINPETGGGPYFEAADAPDSLYRDGKLTKKALYDLRRLAKQEKPFFLAVGFVKPHLPFNAPKKYFDMYDTVQIAENRFRPENLPKQSGNSREIFSYGRLDHYNTLDFHYEAKHAYLACVSFVDAQIGIVLSELKELGLEENTIVVLLGDHGWHLGEHNFWGKHNTLHNALHAPLIIKTPGVEPHGIDELVEYLDIYPTICELTGIEIPEHLQGESMVGLMNQENSDWKNTVFAEWKGARTVLSERYSYSYWFEEKHNGTHMLFDHQVDPDENKNVAGNTEYESVVIEHRAMIDSLYTTFDID